MSWMPCLVATGAGSEVPVVRLGHPLVDRYLEFVAARGRPNTMLAAGYGLKVFFSIVGKDPVELTTADVLEFITAQRGNRRVMTAADSDERGPIHGALTVLVEDHNGVRPTFGGGDGFQPPVASLLAKGNRWVQIGHTL